MRLLAHYVRESVIFKSVLEIYCAAYSFSTFDSLPILSRKLNSSCHRTPPLNSKLLTKKGGLNVNAELY